MGSAAGGNARKPWYRTTRVDGYPFVNPVEQGGENRGPRGSCNGENRKTECPTWRTPWHRWLPTAWRHGAPVGVVGQDRRVHCVDEAPVKVVSIRAPGGDPLPFDVRTQQRVDLRPKAACRPGSTRQSTTASACCGITLALYPALSIVGLAVPRSVAPMTRANPPILWSAVSRSGVSTPRSRPVSSDTAARNSRTASVRTSGKRWAPIRATVLRQRGDRVVLVQNDPCPAMPVARSRIHETPFSAVSTRYRRLPFYRAGRRSGRSRRPHQRPGDPVEQLRRFSTSQCDPHVPPASHRRKANTSSRGGTVPSRPNWRASASVIPAVSFMSMVPRPRCSRRRSHRRTGALTSPPPRRANRCQVAVARAGRRRARQIARQARENALPRPG